MPSEARRPAAPATGRVWPVRGKWRLEPKRPKTSCRLLLPVSRRSSWWGSRQRMRGTEKVGVALHQDFHGSSVDGGLDPRLFGGGSILD